MAITLQPSIESAGLKAKTPERITKKTSTINHLLREASTHIADLSVNANIIAKINGLAGIDVVYL